MQENIYATPESSLADPIQDKIPLEFYVVSLKKFTVLFCVTLGLYSIYWFYQNWKNYRTIHNNKVSPVPRAIFNIFFTHSLCRKIDNALLQKNITHQWKPMLQATLYVLLSLLNTVYDYIIGDTIAPINSVLISIGILFLYLPIMLNIQAAINVSQQDRAGSCNAQFTAANYVWVAIGLLFWALVAVGFVMEAGLFIL